MQIEQSLKAVRDVFVNYPKQIELNETALKKIDQEIQDILHAIELNNFNASNGYILAKELQKARQERRKLKDELEMLEPIKSFLKHPKPTEKTIGNTLGDVRGVVQRQGNRKYTMRVRDDLQELVNR